MKRDGIGTILDVRTGSLKKKVCLRGLDRILVAGRMALLDGRNETDRVQGVER